MENREWRTENGEWRMYGGWWMMDGGWRHKMLQQVEVEADVGGVVALVWKGLDRGRWGDVPRAFLAEGPNRL